MTDERAVVRYVSWRDLCPWLILLRTFRLAVQPPLLAAATLGVLLMPMGWSLSGWIFLPKQWSEVHERWEVLYPFAAPGTSLRDRLAMSAGEYLPAATINMIDPYLRFAEPLAHSFHQGATLREIAYSVFGLLWSLALWAILGGFITRYATVSLTTDEFPTIGRTLRMAARRYLAYLLAPLYPLLGVVLIAVPIAILGLPLRLHEGAGAILAGIFWVLVIAASLAATWLIVGLLFGGPLMWPAISAEREGEAFDAFSRSYSYVYGKPLHYFFYVFVAALFGGLCFLVVQGVAGLVIEFGFWALSWGGGRDHVKNVRDVVDLILAGNLAAVDLVPSKSLVLGGMMLALFVGLVRAVATAFTFSFFWCVASAIYLLLRQDVDGKEIDEIYLEPPMIETSAADTPPPASESPPAAEAPPQAETIEPPAG